MPKSCYCAPPFSVYHCTLFRLSHSSGPGERCVSNCLYMSYQNPGGERMGSDPLASEKVVIDRKIFFLDLKENQRGRFLKITEDVGGRRDTIMLPAPAFRDFAAAFARLVELERTLPAVQEEE